MAKHIYRYNYKYEYKIIPVQCHFLEPESTHHQESYHPLSHHQEQKELQHLPILPLETVHNGHH
ncbi:hypothetical protein Hanom_Chr14g01320291 [Helianthus anomalus]